MPDKPKESWHGYQYQIKTDKQITPQTNKQTLKQKGFLTNNKGFNLQEDKTSCM